MPTIVLTSPKGGAGKSTTAVILGTELAQLGYPVTMLNCDLVSDEKAALRIWEKVGPVPAGITLKHDITEKDVIREIKAGEGDGKIVIVDLGGAASLLATRAISQADLVLVPIRPSPLDASAAEHIVRMIYIEEETLGRQIPWAAVITAAKNIKSKHHKKIVADLIEAEATIIEPELTERGAYQDFFSEGQGGDLHSMTPTATHANAIDNAQRFTQAVLAQLTKVAE